MVIRCQDNDLPNKYHETITDAALLAAIYSKEGKKGASLPVSFTRCRDVSKPKGFVAGMVRLTGKVGCITIDTKFEKKRLERLEATKNKTLSPR